MKNIKPMTSSSLLKGTQRHYFCLLDPDCIQQIVQKLLAVLLLEPLKSRSPMKETAKNLKLSWKTLNKTMSTSGTLLGFKEVQTLQNLMGL